MWASICFTNGTITPLCPYHDITGGMKYHIKGCAGQGGFAQVYKANVDSDPDNVVALKVMNAFQIIFL